MILRPLTPADAPLVAAMHRETQPGTLLSDLGQGFLTIFYEDLASAPTSFGVAAEDNGRLVGYTTAVISTGGLFTGLLKRQRIRVVLAAIGAILRRPGLVPKLIQAILYPTQEGAGPNEPEWLTLAVLPQYRRQGLASQMFGQIKEACRARGYRRINAVVDNANVPSTKMVLSLGFQPRGETIVSGRKMTLFNLDL